MIPPIKVFKVLSFLVILSTPFRTFAHIATHIPGRGANDHEYSDVKKQKQITKSYSVQNEDKLEIDNQFGNVIVRTWNKDKFVVDITIEARASSDERAAALLDKLDVKDQRQGNVISIKTVLDRAGGKKTKGNTANFHIDYIVHMPSTNRLSIKNSFGETEVPDFKGRINLVSEFGSVRTGKLENVESLFVRFGKADIAAADYGNIRFEFNDGSRIGQVGGALKITSLFSQNVQLGIRNGIQDLSLTESYSDVRIIITKDLSAIFDIHTSFSSFNNDSDVGIEEEQRNDKHRGPRLDKNYKGQAGEGKGKITIRSSFGKVRLSYYPYYPVKGHEKGKKTAQDDEKDS